MEIPVVIGIAAAVAVVFMILGFFIGSFVRMKTSEKEIGSASQEATRIINNALTEAEAAKKASLVEAKDEASFRRRQRNTRKTKRSSKTGNPPYTERGIP